MQRTIDCPGCTGSRAGSLPLRLKGYCWNLGTVGAQSNRPFLADQIEKCTDADISAVHRMLGFWVLDCW